MTKKTTKEVSCHLEPRLVNLYDKLEGNKPTLSTLLNYALAAYLSDDLDYNQAVDNLLAFEKLGIRLPPSPTAPAAEMFIPMTRSAADLAHTQAASWSVSGVEGDDTIELHTSAPRVELERDNERKKRCEGCESLTYSLLVPGCKTLIPVCRKMSCKLCVDICDEDCPLVKATVDKLDAALEEQVYCGGKTQEAKAHLTALQTKLLELKSNQEYMLREEYGVRWHQMTGTIAGSGYEVCEELLGIINGMMGES